MTASRARAPKGNGRGRTSRPTPAPGADSSVQPSAPAGEARPALTIIIPAFNEARRFDTSIARLESAIAHRAIDPATTEFIVVDDGSTDATGERARALLGAYPHSAVHRLAENSGKGAAVRVGMTCAAAPIAVYMDADLAVDPIQVPALIAPLQDAAISIGSRSIPGSMVENDSVHRTVMGRMFNRIVNAVTHVSLGDTQCGFKAFRTPVARLLFHFTVIDRYAFDVELLYLARRFGLPIAEVPVRWTHVQGSRIRPLRDPITMVYDVLSSRVGLRNTLPVHAALLTGGSTPATRAELADIAGRVAGPAIPILADHPDGVMVLFPLWDRPEADLLCAALEDALPDSGLHRRTVTAGELAAMAPLKFGYSGGLPTPPPLPALRAAATAPTARAGGTGRPHPSTQSSPRPDLVQLVALNWRDLAHPQAGGSEALIDRLLTGLAAGAMTWLSSAAGRSVCTSTQ